MLLFVDYEKAILADYKNKREHGVLPLVFLRPTPAALRDECIAVCRTRYDKRDARALWAFFGQGDDQTSFLQAISRLETDKFKPLANFLKGGTASPEPKNLELLAWLIDFQPRPVDRFKMGSEDPAISKDDPKVGTSGGDGIKKDETLPTSDEQAKKVFNFNLGRAVLAILLLALIVVSIRYQTPIVGEPSKEILQASSGEQACMFWDGDHYQPVSCNQRLANTLVIALDSEKLIHFNKITQQDTITERSKGFVWYVKYNGNLEFYTSSGFHPIDPRLRLKPITDYMIRKYIRPGQAAGQRSK